MKSVEQLLAEATDKIKALETENKQLKESNSGFQKTAAAATLGQLITEAKLPEAAVNDLKNRFKDASSVEGMKEAVASHVELVKQLRVIQKDNGAGDNGTNNESDNQKTHDDLVKTIQEAYGVTKEQAELMAE